MQQLDKQKCINSNIFAMFAIRNACEITKTKRKEEETKAGRKKPKRNGVSIQASCSCSTKHEIH